MRSHAGRLTIMVPAIFWGTWTLLWNGDLDSWKFGVAFTTSAFLLIAGYLGPSIKVLAFGKEGARLETREEQQRAENREVSAEITEEIETGTDDPVDVDETIHAARLLAASHTLDSILQMPDDTGVEMTIYVFDDDEGGLVPLFGHNERVDTQPPWKPGQGVVGTAYAENKIAVAVGASVADGTFGLDEEQQAVHADLKAVAAAPVRNAADEVIAVVAASERGDGETYLDTERAREMLTATADACARVLIDLLGWFRDAA